MKFGSTLSQSKKYTPLFDNVKLFLRTILISYGVLGFSAHIVPAVLIFSASFFHPMVGLMGLAGNLISTSVALWVGAHREIWKAGIFGVNGLLIGLALGMYSVPTVRLVVFLIIGASAVGVFSVLLGAKFSRNDLPILSLPFLLVIYPLLLTVGMTKTDQSLFSKIALLRNLDNGLFDVLPLELFQFIKMYGNILFQENLISGVLVLIAITLYSRVSLLYSLWGGVVGLATYTFFHGSLDGFHGLNYVLTALAFGGYFVVSNVHAWIFVTLAVVSVGLIDTAAAQVLGSLSASQPQSLPPLVLAFNVVTLSFLYPLKMTPLFQEQRRLVPVPLGVIKSPEANLRWAKRWLSRKYYQKTLLTFPFMGRWSVLQGHDGEWTHKDQGRYAWDFVIRDEYGEQQRALGLNLTDFFAFGLPVLAPAPGTIYAVVNTVEDNPPRAANTERNWGNYLIIDHGNGEFSEISHFKQHSIIVIPGQYVERGQLLGHCGNSGRSPVPHIHFQLQDQPKVGASSLPALFSEGQVNDQIQVNFNPQQDDFVEPIDLEAEESWTLLGKETETWSFACQMGLYKCKEQLFFTTDAWGLPIIVSKNHFTWYILDKPSFVEIVPDFKTFPSLLTASGWMKIVGESLILPKKLVSGLTWDKGHVTKQADHLWNIETQGRKVVIDTKLGKIQEARLAENSKFKFIREV